MKNIRLFTKWLCSVMTLLAVLLCLAWLTPQAVAAEVIDGKVTFVIEHKNMTLKEAQAALTNKTAIPLKVSLIFEGGWIDAFSAGKIPGIDASNFAFGIATNATGRDEASNPLLRSNIPALIYASASIGNCLQVPAQPEAVFIDYPGWFEAASCPEFAYSAGFSNASRISQKYRDTTINGDPAKILDLFNIYVQLQALKSVYIRGIDCNTAGDKMSNTDDETTLITTPGTTILNFLAGTTVYTYPGGPTSAADWTLSGSPKYGGNGQIETDYYGGVIPGGIFIEQVPELTQFERSSMA